MADDVSNHQLGSEGGDLREREQFLETSITDLEEDLDHEINQLVGEADLNNAEISNAENS